MVIEKNSDSEVVGYACNGLEAIEMCKKYKFDIILMDIIMPELNCIEAITKIKILVLYSVGDEDNIIRSKYRPEGIRFFLGVQGYDRGKNNTAHHY